MESCVSCLSEKLADVQIDDDTSGSMTTTPNVDKTRLWRRNRYKQIQLFLRGKGNDVKFTCKRDICTLKINSAK